MLKKIKFKSGTYPSSEDNLEIELSPVTVFIGPNNSGKSQTLIEIQKYISSGDKSFSKLLDNIELFEYSFDEFSEKFLNNLKLPESIDYRPYDKNHEYIGKYDKNKQIYLPSLRHDLSYINNIENSNSSSLFEVFSYYVLKLDGYNRLSLIQDKPTGDLQRPPQNSFSKLFVDDALMEKVRNIVFDAFKRYLVIDPTNPGSFRLRLSDEKPASLIEKSLTKEAIGFHKNAILLTDSSDGVKAFIGIVISLIADESKCILIDEPEAFLHPTLSYKLGKEMTSLLNEDQRLFISTHSADFLMGCVQNNVGINIVRLTYDAQGSTARVLTQEKLKPLMQNPLLRSIGVFNALFYNAVIVTEADADRAFYQEINERLLREKDPRGIDGCLFLNAQNKQTVWDIVKPLRELGIPTVGIVDIDVIKEGGENWNKVLNGIYIPEANKHSFRADRENLVKAFDGKDFKRNGGINLLNSEDREFCSNFFENLMGYGCAVVPVGEIERWLPELSIDRSKNSWLRNIFEKMGDNPSSDAYVKPQKGDVWDFIGKISKWINNPNKKGVPK
ncbi:ATP-dependent endonuclease [Glaesserella sp.]|uniref:ATP-dependent nuclease n=1 Tax=Glaesserella sp. TaxID=2094731 RepID=UPI0035A1B6B6